MYINIIIWGHKLHSHTHSYIHNGFYRAFKHLGYNTYWFDDNDDVSSFNFANSLFLTEGQCSNKIPIKEDCFYVLHGKILKDFPVHPSKKLLLQPYRLVSFASGISSTCKLGKLYYFNPLTVYFPWATDLLPDEIEANIEKVKNDVFKESNTIHFVGMFIQEVWQPFIEECNKNGINFIHCGGFSNTNVSIEDNVKLIQESYLAPAIQTELQCENGYIPCRLLKNISYGKFGITNNPTAYEFFDKKIVFNKDKRQLFYDAVEYKNKNDKKTLIEQMQWIKEEHTYINRAKELLWFFNIN